MTLMTGAQYIASLRKLNTRVYMFGKKIDNWVDHPIIRPSINCVAATYDLAHDPQYEDLMTATSSLTGHKINRFTHLHQSPDDLVKKVKMQRLLGQKTASCFQRCVGMDSFNAVYSTTYEIDQAHGTHYHENFKKFLIMVQDQDLTVDGAMTDPKATAPKHRTNSPTRICTSTSSNAALMASLSAAPNATRLVLSIRIGTSSCRPSLCMKPIKTGLFRSPARRTPKAFT